MFLREHGFSLCYNLDVMKKIRELSLEEFQSFVESAKSKNYMQSTQMYQRYLGEEREQYLLGLVDDANKTVIAGLVHIIYSRLGKKVFAFSRGPIMSDGKNTDDLIMFLKGCKKFLKSKHGMTLQVTLNTLVDDVSSDLMTKMQAAGFKKLGEYEQVKWVYALDFAKVEDLPKMQAKEQRGPIDNIDLAPELEQKLFRHLRTSHRRYIRYADERYGIKVRELKVEEYNVLQDLLEESGKTHGFAPRSQKFFEQLLKYFGDNVVAIVAELPDKTPVAAAFFILYGDEVIYLSGGFDREYKKMGAPHLVQWTMIKYAYANGYRQYNFWGTNPDPNDGVFQFKEGFHGEVQEFTDAFITSLSPLGMVYVKKLHYAKHRDL